jgi:hypothetical protein
MIAPVDEHEDLRNSAREWIRAHHPGDPGWKLPQSALEVADDRQFGWLQDWQRKLYDAGFVGSSVRSGRASTAAAGSRAARSESSIRSSRAGARHSC